MKFLQYKKILLIFTALCTQNNVLVSLTFNTESNNLKRHFNLPALIARPLPDRVRNIRPTPDNLHLTFGAHRRIEIAN